MAWGLAAPNQDVVLRALLPDLSHAVHRRKVALEHQAKCLERATQLAAALDAPDELPVGVGPFLVAGDAIATDSRVEVNGRDGTITVVDQHPGDGTVLRSSTLMDERIGPDWTSNLISPIDWTQVMFLFSDPCGMTEDPVFADNMLYWLLEDRRP